MADEKGIPEQIKVEVRVRVVGKTDAYNTNVLGGSDASRENVNIHELPTLIDKLVKSTTAYVQQKVQPYVQIALAVGSPVAAEEDEEL